MNNLISEIQKILSVLEKSVLIEERERAGRRLRMLGFPLRRLYEYATDDVCYPGGPAHRPIMNEYYKKEILVETELKCSRCGYKWDEDSKEFLNHG